MGCADYCASAMRRLAMAGLLTVLVTVAIPGTASAGWQIPRALLIADAEWGPAPCGHVKIRRLKWIPSFLESHALAAADADSCTIYLRPDWKPAGWGDLCTVILHERGHIDGYTDPRNVADPEHSSDPNNLMAADYLLQVNYVIGPHGRLKEYRQSGNWRCWDRGRPILKEAGMLPVHRHGVWGHRMGHLSAWGRGA